MSRLSFNYVAGIAALALALGAGTAAAQPVVSTVISEQFFSGDLLGGSYLDTHAEDGVSEIFQEVQTGGKPSKRTSKFEHLYEFDLQPGIAHTLYFKATFTDSGEGDGIMLRWSDDDWTYPLLMIYEPEDSGTVRSAPLPPELSGMLLIWMQDNDRTPGYTTLDTFEIDWICVETTPSGETPPPPLAPSGLMAAPLSAEMNWLSWEDQSITEDGFRIRRWDGSQWFEVATAPADTTSYVDTGLTANTFYEYQVVADNAGVYSDASNTATATTLPPSTFDIEEAPFAGHHAWGPNGELGMVTGLFNSNEILYTERVQGSWTAPELVAPGYVDPRVAFLGDGSPVVSYIDGTKLTFARRLSAGNWSTETVDKTYVVAAHSMAVDPLSGEICLSYRLRLGNDKGLFFARRDGSSGAWVKSLVDLPPGRLNRLAFHPVTGTPFIAYMLYGANYIDTIKLATQGSNGAWTTEVVADGLSGGGVQVAVDPITGEAAVLYYEYGTGAHLLRRNGPTWDDEIFPIPTDNADTGSLAYDSSGTLHVAYVDAGSNLVLASQLQNSSTWWPEIIHPFDWEGDPYWLCHTGLAIDPSGNPSLPFNAPNGANYELRDQTTLFAWVPSGS